MWMKQMTVDDWLAMFREQPATISQIDHVEARQQAGLPLATWEHNCLKAFQQLYDVAAE